MPTSSGHYWGLSGVLLAAPLYGPWNGAAALKGTRLESDAWLYGWTALWAVRLSAVPPFQ